jgi:hypothetical protein
VSYNAAMIRRRNARITPWVTETVIRDCAQLTSPWSAVIATNAARAISSGSGRLAARSSAGTKSRPLSSPAPKAIPDAWTSGSSTRMAAPAVRPTAIISSRATARRQRAIWMTVRRKPEKWFTPLLRDQKPAGMRSPTRVRCRALGPGARRIYRSWRASL